MPESFYQIDLPALCVAILTAIICALIGNFLILRKQAMIGDALSHVVLPGIAAGFLLSSAVTGLPILLGAMGACLLSVLLIEIFRRFGRMDRGTAMGIVFTTMFAAGILLLEKKIGTRVHLDAHHALYGALELVYWPSFKSASALLSSETWHDTPEQIVMLAFMTLVTLIFVIFLFKELQLSTFDPAFAHNTGFAPEILGAALVFMTALAAVSAFGAVGSILVIAMFICPAATSFLLTKRLKSQLCLSVFFAVTAAIAGYALATLLPALLGLNGAINAAAMIALTAGLMQCAVMAYIYLQKRSNNADF